MNVLVWQWGRNGAMPRFAMLLAEGFRGLPDVQVTLSLSRQAEILSGAAPPVCELPMDTYRGLAGLALRAALGPFAALALARRLRRFAPRLAICAAPGPIDLIMVLALRLVGARIVAIVHDADSHPGDGWPIQMKLQRLLCRRADAIVALSSHVASALQRQGFGRRPLLTLRHPPIGFNVSPRAAHDGPVRLLFFGRLLPYKGIGLLAEALQRVGTGLTLRAVGLGPESPELDALRRLPNASVENRWVAEDEIGGLLAWSDALVLPYTEASQSGVAAAALAAGRIVIATRVGGLEEQVAGQPGAFMCDPNTESLAGALAELRDGRIEGAQPMDPADAWRDMAKTLLGWEEDLRPSR